MADRGNEFEKFKRQASDLIADLHARNLAIPAGVLVAMILAAIFVLPKSPTPPPPVNATPIATNKNDKKLALAKVANISVVAAIPLEDAPETYGESNPFKVGTDTNCEYKVGSSPRQFRCIIGSTVVYYECRPSDKGPGCTMSDQEIAGTGGTGSTGGSTQNTGGTTPPPDNPPDGNTKTVTTYYTVDVTYDGKTYKGLEAGDQLPSSGNAIVFYAGPNSSAKKAGFVLGDNVSVQGAEADPDLGTFEISVGDEVVMTESNYQVHTMKLKKITKVTKVSD